MLIDHFNNTIDTWINSLNTVELERLLIKPAPESWSLGQLYMHLLDETDYYMQQVEICLGTNDNAELEKTDKAVQMFRNNAFPDERARRDAGLSDDMEQPVGIFELKNDLISLRSKMNLLGKRIMETQYKGKTKHPGLGYFSAMDWFQFAEMHMRHHFKQKRRIEDYLQNL